MIPEETWQEVNTLLGLLGYGCITDNEKAKIELLITCDSIYSNLSTECQVIYLTAQILRMRGISCDVTNINYLQDLSNCKNCGLNIPDIIVDPDATTTLYMQGGRTKRGCDCW